MTIPIIYGSTHILPFLFSFSHFMVLSTFDQAKVSLYSVYDQVIYTN